MFTFHGRQYAIHDAAYNTTALNERAVEIPIAKAWIDDHAGHGLEVGNVLGHYFPTRWRVVDLYEISDGVDNVDLFELDDTFDWIVSISTVEHTIDPPAAIHHLRSLLRPDGALFVTAGAGQSHQLDSYLATGAGATWATTLVRSGGVWCETVDPQFLPYGYSTRWAESVWIGEFSWQYESNSTAPAFTPS